ncbi:MAG: transcription elongation factor subunit Spt4 [Thermoplasmataceae archaeon]
MKVVLKACKKCKRLTDGKVCISHPEEKLSSEWSGFIYVKEHRYSVIAERAGITSEGMYAIKVRQ